MNNKYCVMCKKQGIIKISEVLTEYGPLCLEHDFEMKKVELSNSNKNKVIIPKIDSNNIFKFCKIN